MNQYFDDDGQQKYAMTFPMVWADGSELTCYASPDNRRLILKHSSGSHIEFKNDGTLVVKAVKDLHINSGVLNDGESSATNIKCESDLNLEVTGKLSISCETLDMVAKDSAKVNTSGDFIVKGNNIVEKATEQISMEATKSVYTSTGELRENIVTRTSVVGDKEGGNAGGQENIKVQGHYVLENTDPKGGITIKSAGYMNIVTAAERIDVTGDPAALSPQYDPTPQGKATYTHIVRPYPGPTPKGVPGSAWFEVGPGGLTETITGPVIRSNLGPTTTENYTGPYVENYLGPKTKNVKGIELATIEGIYKVKAAMIFLN